MAEIAQHSLPPIALHTICIRYGYTHLRLLPHQAHDSTRPAAGNRPLPLEGTESTTRVRALVHRKATPTHSTKGFRAPQPLAGPTAEDAASTTAGWELIQARDLKFEYFKLKFPQY